MKKRTIIPSFSMQKELSPHEYQQYLYYKKGTSKQEQTKKWLEKKGMTYFEYLNHLARKKGFKSFHEYKKSKGIDLTKKHKEWLKKNGKYHETLILFRLTANLNSVFKKSDNVKSNYSYNELKKCDLEIDEIIKKLTPAPKKVDDFHIDHIIPKSQYNLKDKKEFKKCNSPENLRWLEKNENIKKGKRLHKQLIKNIPKEIYPKQWGGVIPHEKNILE